MKSIELTEKELNNIISLVELTVWASETAHELDETREVCVENVGLLEKLKKYKDE